jgi:hypothetical protein
VLSSWVSVGGGNGHWPSQSYANQKVLSSLQHEIWITHYAKVPLLTHSMSHFLRGYSLATGLSRGQLNCMALASNSSLAIYQSVTTIECFPPVSCTVSLSLWKFEWSTFCERNPRWNWAPTIPVLMHQPNIHYKLQFYSGDLEFAVYMVPWLLQFFKNVLVRSLTKFNHIIWCVSLYPVYTCWEPY